jgi:hypothetical protein
VWGFTEMSYTLNGKRAAVKTQTTNLIAINLAGRAKLADDTYWCIAPLDIRLTYDWAAGTEVSIEPSGTPLWQYKLTNVKSGVEVSVAPSEEKF